MWITFWNDNILDLFYYIKMLLKFKNNDMKICISYHVTDIRMNEMKVKKLKERKEMKDWNDSKKYHRMMKSFEKYRR